MFGARGRAQGRGRVVRLAVQSKVLKGNRLGDPWERELPVYLPPGYDEGDRRYPVAFCLAGYTGIGETHLAWKGWGESLPERLDRLHAAGRIPALIVALPDCFTRLGGSQYINSSVCGRYDDHLVQELVPLVDRELRTLPSREHRAVLGKSSGGFGAIVHAMLHPDVWGGAACHSGDAAFDLCFLTGLPTTLNVIARAGGVRAFVDDFPNRAKVNSNEVHAMMHCAMAACFDPQPDHPDGFELPVDLHTGRLRDDRWARWMAWDPVRLIPEHARALSSLRHLFIDCGDRDQYHLHYGARQMRDALKAAGVRHEYEEFPDNHSGIGYRMDVSLPKLARAIAP